MEYENLPSEESELLQREEEFHDEWAESVDVKALLVDEHFECATAPEGRKIMAWLGDIRGQKLLDVGCGAGEGAVYFAKCGAQVTATDLSQGMLNVVQKLAEHHTVHVETKQSTASRLPFPDESFDIVYAGNLLHHVDLAHGLDEMCRVLRPGGTLVTWDPLTHNPVINVYRAMAEDVRTPDEHPLRMQDIREFRSRFSEVEYECYWLTTLWLFLRLYFIERINPNHERYWKKVVREHKRFERTYYRLERIDRFLLKAFPFLKRYCWNVVVCCRK